MEKRRTPAVYWCPPSYGVGITRQAIARSSRLSRRMHEFAGPVADVLRPVAGRCRSRGLVVAATFLMIFSRKIGMISWFCGRAFQGRTRDNGLCVRSSSSPVRNWRRCVIGRGRGTIRRRGFAGIMRHRDWGLVQRNGRRMMQLRREGNPWALAAARAGGWQALTAEQVMELMAARQSADRASGGASTAG